MQIKFASGIAISIKPNADRGITQAPTLNNMYSEMQWKLCECYRENDENVRARDGTNKAFNGTQQHELPSTMSTEQEKKRDTKTE